ncbi:hypothetical protein HPB49_019026 [Dermacentor silvarum]|uniref:Uncharacterized protein n=1 Tax=Dermacentor silvarum TaxID=543639 RepID=A0ACB8CGZ6_DERSI|nr:hypothetical protein HPB49_019026 [Dermacentor silvarum]
MAPHATCKGVIRRVDIRGSQSAITRNIVHERNPHALAAKRIKTLGSVIFLFDGLRVPNFVRYGLTLFRCYIYRKQFDVCFILVGVEGVEPSTHVCTPNCKFGGEDHPTGDKACKKRFQTPYVVRARRKERARSRSATRERSRSKSGGAQVRLEEGTPGGKPTFGTAWAD